MKQLKGCVFNRKDSLDRREEARQPSASERREAKGTGPRRHWGIPGDSLEQGCFGEGMKEKRKKA